MTGNSPRGELLRRHPAPLRRAPQQEHLHAGRFVHAVAGSVYAPLRLMGGPRYGCHLPVMQNSRPFVFVFHDLNGPKGDPCASRCCCSSATFALSAAQSCLPATSTRPLSGSRPQTDNAVSLRLKRPSITPSSRGRHTACCHCGAPVPSLTATSGLTAVALSCSPTRNTSG